ncbi:hypothetical protein B1R94_11980 [Mycolicibacterium litorale]|nr:hypothetical protein B1R94_11980 [Mycolicibacterium litorale]
MATPKMGTSLGEDTRPRYQTIANALEHELALLEPGSPVASEHELAKRFGINRLTAQAALEELERRYIVRRTKGKGTFVARRLPYVVSQTSSPSWSASVRAAGASPSVATVSLQERPASQWVADRLRIAKGRRVFILLRRRFVDGSIAGCTTSYLPGDLLPRFRSRLTETASLHEVLADKYGIEPVRAWVKVELRPAPIDIAAHLELRGTPMVHRLSAALEDPNSGRVVEFGQTWLRPDAVDLVIEMKRSV